MSWYRSLIAAVPVLMTPQQKRFISLNFLSGKMSVPQISLQLGLPATTIQDYLRQQKGQQVSLGRPMMASPQQVQEWVQQYQNGKSLTMLAYDSGYSSASIKEALLRSGVQLRDHTDALLNRRKETFERAPRTGKTPQLPDFVVNYITRDQPGMSPDFYFRKLAVPVGQIVKFLVDQRLPMAPTYLRYVPKPYHDLYWQTNPSAAQNAHLNPQNSAPQPVQPAPPAVAPSPAVAVAVATPAPSQPQLPPESV